MADPAAYLGSRPDRPDRDDNLFFLTASSVFLLGMSAFLGYSYLDPVRERLDHGPGRCTRRTSSLCTRARGFISSSWQT